MTYYSRRQIIKMLGVTAAAGAAWKLGFNRQNTELVEVSESRVLMGTIVNLTVIGKDEAKAKTAVSATLAHMSKLEARLSRYQPDSEVSRLNRNGRLANASQPLLDIVAQSHALSEITDGAFDISIKPLLDLYQSAKSEGKLPSESEIAAARTLVNFKQIRVRGNQISFDQPGMSITLDGIGKGYIVDAGTAVLRENGFTNVLVEAGGDLMASGEKGAAMPWHIGIQSPREEELATAIRFNLTNQAVATSGDYMQSFSEDHQHHHIIDPRTGYSAPELASVTIKAPTAIIADGLATAVMVIGQDVGLQRINQLSDVDAFVITKSLETGKSAHF